MTIPVTPPPPQAIDIVTVLVTIAAAFFGDEMAAVIGPYSAIILGAVVGGAWSASRRTSKGRLNTAGYMTVMILLTILITVPAADYLSKYVGTQSRNLLAPVAVAISAIGEKWPEILHWAIGLLRLAIEKRAGAKTDRDGKDDFPPTQPHTQEEAK